ncbi:MAG: hypothetical protein M0R37_14640, partial [Bacteroidales bacterium]|nr:hypothetical protein [Bacteroidales bacterium]
MAYQKPRIASVNGRIIRVVHPEAVGAKTYLVDDVAAAGVSLTVADSGSLANADLLRVGRLGSETCEIIAVSGAVTRGQTVGVTDLSFAHSPGEPVERVIFDQFKVYGNTTNTTSGATLIDTVDQTPEEDFTTYLNTGTEYAYYFVLEYDSTTATDSDAYSDGVASTGYPENTVGSIIERALDETGTRECERISYQWTLNQVNDCLKEVRRKLKT